MIKEPNDTRFQNSQEVFTKYIPGYRPEVLPSYDDITNYSHGIQTGSMLGRSLASEIEKALDKIDS